MRPHCDTVNSLVATALKKALESTGNLNLILRHAPENSEAEIKKAFEETIAVWREGGKKANEIIDRCFRETGARLHREPEDDPYSGLKPSGLDSEPVLTKVHEVVEK